MKMILPHEIHWILQVFSSTDEEIFLVGGCVRDMLLGKELHDYDMTTSMSATNVMELFRQKGCNVIPTGIKHGTITVVKDNMHVEITTYRIDHDYQNHRTPNSVTFTKHLSDDLKRRDFTMNAIAYHPDLGIIDPMHGVKDINDRIIKCVGDPNIRFQEDALRILRAIRFHCTLNFTIEKDTFLALQKHVNLLSFISKERIKEEFIKIITSDKQNVLQYLRDTNILPYIIPEMTSLYDFNQYSDWHPYDLFKHTDLALNHSIALSLEIKLALILHDIGKVHTQVFDGKIAHYYHHAKHSVVIAKDILDRLTFDNKTKKYVLLLIQYHDYYVQTNKKVLRKFLSKINNDFDLAIDILTLQYCDDSAKNKDKVQDKLSTIEESIVLLKQMRIEHNLLSMKDLAINGFDLLELGYKGKEIGYLLKEAFAYIVDDPKHNDKEKLLNYIKQHHQ